MKILMIFNNYEYRGGEETYVANLTRLLTRKGHHVIPYFRDSRDIKGFKEKIRAAFGLFWNFKVERELDSLIKKHRPDIAHFHNIYPLISPTAYRVCRKNNIRVVQTIHNYKFMCPKNSLFRNNKTCELCVNKVFFYPSVINGCYHRSRLASLAYSAAFFLHNSLLNTFTFIDAYVFPSPFTKRYYETHGIVPPRKAHLLPYFVLPQTRRTKPAGSTGYFLFAGRLSEEKGVASLLETFAGLPRMPLILIGNGPLRTQSLRRYSAFKNIRFISYMNNAAVLKYVRGARAVIVPSLWFEVQPNIILEAIACGKPVIVPKSANFSSWLPPGVSLMYAKDGMAKAVTAAVRRKFNPSVIKNEYTLHYSPAVHYKQLISIYENCIKT